MKKQRGFSVIEGLIVLVVLGLLASAGWLVWQRQKKSTSPTTNNNPSTAIAQLGNKKQNSTVSYTASDTGFTFKAPAVWEKIEGHGIVVRFKAPNTDKNGTTNYQANIQVHSEDYTGTLASFAKAQAEVSKTPTAEIANRQVDQEVSSTTNGVSTASYENTYTLTYDNTQVHCLTVMHVAKGKALDISACSLASKWDNYKNTFMQGILGYTY